MRNRQSPRVRQAGVDQADRWRQDAAKKILGAGRRECNIAGDRAVTPGPQNIVGDVLQERGVERRRLVERERRHEPRLGPARRRRLGHDGDAATRGRRLGCRRRCVARLDRLGFAVETICTVHAMPPPKNPLKRSGDAAQCLVWSGDAPINSGSLPTSRQTPKSYRLHQVVIAPVSCSKAPRELVKRV